MRNLSLAILFTFFLFASAARAQQAEVTITFNEQFFDALLDSLFEHGGPPEIPLASNEHGTAIAKPGLSNAFTTDGPCSETVKLLRENDAVKTAVRFREGKVYMPIAFSGGYNPPLIGCVDFAGYAESNIDLEFDKQGQKLIGRVRVLNVVLNGTGGIGSSVVTKMVQAAIDKKLNPIDLIKADKLSFTLPVQNTSIRMEATGIRSEVVNSSLQIHVDYNFPK